MPRPRDVVKEDNGLSIDIITNVSGVIPSKDSDLEGETPTGSSGISPTEPTRITRVSKAHRIVCTSCRQSKVRCVGGNERTCERCERLGLECKRDANFRRTSKSRKIAELEQQVQLLSSAFTHSAEQDDKRQDSSYVEQIHDSPEIVSFFHISDINESMNSRAKQSQSTFHPGDYRRPTQPSNNSAHDRCLPPRSGYFNVSGNSQTNFERPKAVLPRSIESAYLTTVEIDELFGIFFDHYHPLLPFLDPFRSPDKYFDGGTHLFWAIISVASRHYQEDVMLFAVLTEWVSKLVWSKVAAPPYTIELVQAIVLISTWNFPTSSIWNDGTSTLISTAVTAAMQLGLHRPRHAQDFIRERTRQEEQDYQVRVSTWSAVIMVSQMTESIFGLLPTTPFDHTIEASCSLGTPFTLPDNLRLKLVIQRFCNRISCLVSRCIKCSSDPFSTGVGDPAADSWQHEMVILEKRLDHWERSLSEKLSVHDRIYVAAARVYTHAMHFFDSSTTEARKQDILKAYNSAVTYIIIVLEADDNSDFLKYMTAYHLKIFFLAHSLIVKVLRSSYARDIDFEAGKRLCNQGIGRISKASVANDDSAGRAGKMVAQVWHSLRTDILEKPPQLMVRSRLGASLLYDFLWAWRVDFDPEAGFIGSNVEMNQDSMTTSNSLNSFGPSINGVFEDALMVNLDFLNDMSWLENMGTL